MDKKILIVEDEALTSMELETCVQSWGYQPLTAFSGEEAISMALNENPDLILMDIMLGGKINGISAAEEIHRDMDVPIVYVSAYTDEETRKEAKSTLPYNFLPKPFDSNMLKYAIEMALSRYEMEKQISESEERFRVLLDSTEDLIFIKDVNSCFTMVNPAFEQFFGVKSDDILGNSVLESFPPEYEEAVLRGYDKRVLNGETVTTETPPIPPSNRILHVIKNPMYNKKGEIVGLCGIARDITKQKKDEELIKKSLYEKEMLMREMNHRVKNNLAVISSLLSAQSSYVDDKKSKDIIKDCQNRARSMALIHERLYQSHDLKRIDFADYISTLVTDLFSAYKVNQEMVSLGLNIPTTMMDVNTAIPLGLILNELVSNSLKYAFPEGRPGEIKISLEKSAENQLSLRVHDNGIGIPDDFDIEKTNSFGLNIVNLLVKQIHGAMEINNDNGAYFNIIFEEFDKKEF